jgi:hypothetical protein
VNCLSNKGLEKLPFAVLHHKFPADPGFLEKWCAFLQGAATKAARLCSSHFSKNPFASTGERYLLKKDAILVYRTLEEKKRGDGYELYEVEVTTTKDTSSERENIVHEFPLPDAFSASEQHEEISTIDDDEFFRKLTLTRIL